MRRILAATIALLLLLAGTASAIGISRTSFPNALQGKHVHVFYTTSGPNAVTEAYARQVLEHMEGAYKRLVTDGGLRAPRGLPIPVVLEGESASLGGAARSAYYGLDPTIQINPRMADSFDLADVVAHELFHVIQSAYKKRDYQEDWAIEGTATIAPFYAFPPEADHRSILKGPMSAAWGTHQETFKTLDYPASLFWYLTAERYGGLQFLRRLLTYAEDLEWERAAQLAAVQGGAPPDTTFDSLWRAVVFDMVQGRMPAGYTSNAWLNSTLLPWQGQAVTMTRGALVKGVSSAGKGFAYYKPLAVAPYSFQLVEVLHDSTAQAELIVSGEATAVEAYLVRPGPNLLNALQNYEARPRYTVPGRPPFDETTAFAPLELDKPVRISGSRNDRTLVLLMRTGWWGHGTYNLSLKPATGASWELAWFTPAALPARPHSPGSPPPLTPGELAALKAGTLTTGAAPLEIVAGQPQYRTVEVTVGDPRLWDGEKVVTVRNPPVRTAAGNLVLPVTTLVRLFGGSANGSRLTLGDTWVEVTAGSTSARYSKGNLRLREAPYFQGDELMAASEVVSIMGCETSGYGDLFSISCPVAP